MSQSPPSSFLEEDPTPDQCWQALSLNYQSCFVRCAQAEGKGVVFEEGIMWTHKYLAISAAASLHIGKNIDRALQWYRRQQPLEGAICWYLTSAPPGDLAARLFARGFALNWQPHWMWCDLRALPHQQSHPSSFTIQLLEREPDHVADLPYYPSKERKARIILHRLYPHYIYNLAAFQESRVVGRCMLNITTGDRGIAGLFSMGVVPSARRQGIGTALAQAACELAQQLGCHHVMLNATPMGEPIYRRAGFQSMGYGHTWYLPPQTLAALASSADQVCFLEAIGLGDTTTLNETVPRLEQNIFHQPTTGGLTPLDIAVRCHQPTTATWLVEHGVTLDLLSAWDLGWKEQLPHLLAEHPELVNLQRGEWSATPLQIAIERNDLELARLLLTVPNDLELKDGAFNSTAMGWAQHFQRTEIITLLEQHRSQQCPPN